MRHLRRSICWLVLIGVAGCASWTTSPSSEQTVLRKPRLSDDSVVLELTFAHIGELDPLDLTSIWNEVDEMKLDTVQRRRLAANGFRGGIAGMHLPQALRDLVDDENSTSGLDNRIDGRSGSVSRSSHRRLQARAGIRNEIVTGETIDSMVVLIDEDGKVSGSARAQAQTTLAVMVQPTGDGRAEIELVPEIHFGQPKQKWVGREGMFQFVVGKERERFEQLLIPATLAPGETLILSGNGKPQSLGEQFFTSCAGTANAPRMLLVRLAQSRDDELFGGGLESKELATSE